ncbi:hypothetical protein KKC59_01200, partial [bacterium]|nr:hypothetical protein [bacterium]
KKEKIDMSKAEFVSQKKDLINKFKDAKIDEIDGLKFVWSDKWIQVRASNTEPIVRIMGEAGSEEGIQKLIDECREALDSEVRRTKDEGRKGRNKKNRPSSLVLRTS